MYLMHLAHATYGQNRPFNVARPPPTPRKRHSGICIDPQASRLHAYIGIVTTQAPLRASGAACGYLCPEPKVLPMSWLLQGFLNRK